jgi:hypothetical protein
VPKGCSTVSLTHRVRFCIKHPLHGFEQVLALASRHASFGTFVHCDLGGHLGHAVVQ